MRRRLCPKKGRKSMEVEKVDEVKQDSKPRVSGAYIRTLVKHLTTKDPPDSGGGGGGSPENENFFSEINKTEKQQKPKKQVRRRLHTTKPYQERLLNMAEARREIVTALKFHRASMKQQEAAGAATNHHHQPPPVQEKKPKSRRIVSLYPTTTATAATGNSYWPISVTAPPLPPAYHDSLNLFLPSQTLGLNLNFQNFENLDTRFYHTPLSSSSTSTSTSSPAAAPVGGKQKVTPENSSGGVSGGMHHAMGDEEMEEIRSLGEKHQIEWNDTINLMTSARWCSFLKNMEMEEDEFCRFDQEFPPWLINGSESSCLQDHKFSDAYLKDPDLPCMDLGEIEGMDGEWLA